MDLWEKLIELNTDIFSEKEIQALLLEMSKSDDEFVKMQAVKIRVYLNQVAKEEITQKEFNSYITDIRDLADINSKKVDTENAALLQRVMIIAGKLLLKNAFTLAKMF